MTKSPKAATRLALNSGLFVVGSAGKYSWGCLSLTRLILPRVWCISFLISPIFLSDKLVALRSAV